MNWVHTYSLKPKNQVNESRVFEKPGFSETWVLRPFVIGGDLRNSKHRGFQELFFALCSLGFGATVREARFGAQFVHRILRSYDGTCKGQSEHAAMELIAQLQLVLEREELVFA